MSSRLKPTVRLPQGTYRGSSYPASLAGGTKAVDVFLGIPYAQSTEGANRFRPAVPLDVKPGDDKTEHDAQLLGLVAPCTDSFAEMTASGEDCLNVNVIRPTRSAPEPGSSEGSGDGEGMPVVVYVHGGAFNLGFGSDRDMISFVASAARDVVSVSFNYRLGPLGFLASGEVREAEGREGLNVGLGDQDTAMRWVRENISHFGGDPKRICVMGISAGAHSVGHHILRHTPSTAPFSRAILESGSATSRAVFHPSHPRQEEQYRSLLCIAGAPTTCSPSEALSFLRNLSARSLMEAGARVWANYSVSVRWPFQPVIDGEGGYIPGRPIDLMRSSAGARVPVMTGFCTHEGTAFVPAAPTGDDFRSFFKVLIPGFGEADLDALDELYPQSEFAAPPPSARHGAHWWRLEAAYAHYAYIAPVLQTAHHASHSRSCGENGDVPPPPVYVYEFAALSGPLGTANHTDQTPFVTRSPAAFRGCPGLEEMATAMHGFWTEFATSTDGRIEGWPEFVSPLGPDYEPREDGGEELGRIMVFGDGNDEGMGAKGKRCKGTPFMVRGMSKREIERIKFWWQRTELSQGLGERS